MSVSQVMVVEATTIAVHLFLIVSWFIACNTDIDSQIQDIDMICIISNDIYYTDYN